MLNFYLDSRWGLHADRLVVSKEQRCARSVPGLSLLQAADLALTSCHLTSDLLVGDVAITQGRHYWACSVEPGSYLVKVSGMAGRRVCPNPKSSRKASAVFTCGELRGFALC